MNLEVANSHLFPFAFMIIFILVYNLESHGYFYMSICRILCYTFSFENIRFAADVYIFIFWFLQEDLLQRKVAAESCYFFFCVTFTYVPWDEEIHSK